MTLQQALRQAHMVLERSRRVRGIMLRQLPAPVRLGICGVSDRHVRRYREAMALAADMLQPGADDLSLVN